jgi:hypothetical protein
LTYANVMASLAMFFVLGGGAYAATTLPKNSVGAKELKPNSVTLAKLAASAKSALKGARGPQGVPGVPGVAGAPGAPGATKVTVRVGSFASGRSVASCLSGEVATGGGGFVDPEAPTAWIWNTTPVQNSGQTPTAWEADAESKEGVPVSVQAYVICAAP